MHTQSLPLSKELKQSLERTPFIKCMQKGKVPRESCAGHLRAMAIISGTLEHQVSMTKDRDLQAVFTGYLPQLPGLLCDLEAMNASEIMEEINDMLHIKHKEDGK